MKPQPPNSRQSAPPPAGESDPALQALRESEARNRALVHAIPDLVFTNRRNGEYLSVHASNPALLAAPPESVLHRRIDEVLPPPIAGQCLDAIAAALDSGTVQEITYALPLDGRIRHFEARIAPCTADTVLTIVRDITARKQAVDELRLFQALVEHASDAIGMSTPAGCHYYQNPAFDRLFGPIGAHPPETLYVDRAVGEEVFRAIEAGNSWQGEVRMYHRNRSILDIHLRAYAIRSPDGVILGLVGIHTDITARKQAEIALRESRARFAALFDANPSGLMLCNRATRVIEQINPAAAALIGLPPDQIVGRVCHGFLCPAERAACPVCDLGQTVDRSERILLRADGVAVPILKTVVPLRLNDADYLLESFIDISERKRAEAELQEKENNYFGLFNTVKQAIYIQNPDGTFVNVNQGAIDLYGYAREEFIGQTPAFLAAPGRNDLPGLAAVFDRAFRGEPQSFEFWGRRKDGTEFPKEVWVVRGRYFGRDVLVAIANDITERKRAEEEKIRIEAELHQARKMESIGRLAGGVAHDFNNMLTVILGNAELALDQIGPGQPAHADLVEIRNAAQRSASLTQQLLAFARKQTIAPRVLDLNETVEGMLQMLRRLIGENIVIDWRPGRPLGPVRMDPVQIDQLLANLCANARDAIAGAGTITISTDAVTVAAADSPDPAGRPPGEYIQLTIADTGCGMDSETLAHIFEPFFTRKGFGKGTGLGLAMVYGIVTQNKGFIQVDSAPGRGARFQICLPCHQDPPEPAPAGAPAGPAARGGETILLVEDEPAILQLTAQMIRQQGYTVLTAQTPAAALRTAREHPGPIHLLVTDIVMPEMNGQALAQHLLALHPRLRRLFMSGYTANAIAHQGILDAGVFYIQKPFSRHALAARIRQALDAATP